MWRAHLASTMTDLNFTPCQADPDVWMQPAVKPDGMKYYEYVLICVDDILVISHRASMIMDNLSALYCLKENPSNGKRYGTPDRYLDANIGLYMLPGNISGKQKWYMSSDDYVADAIKNVEGKLAEANRQLCVKVSTPMTAGYRPDLDMTRLLSDEQANYFQNLIGVLRWAVELGRIDIHVQVAMLSSYLAQLHQGHLEAVFHIFAYL